MKGKSKSVWRKLVEAMTVAPPQLSRKDLIARLQAQPLEAKIGRSSLMVGVFICPLVIWILCGPLALATIYYVTTSWTFAIVATATLFLLTLGVSYWFSFGSQKKFRLVADEHNVTLFAQGETAWSVAWNDLKIINTKIFGRRAYVLLPNGSEGVWPTFLDSPIHEQSDLRRLVASHRIDLPTSKNVNTLHVVFVAIGLVVAIACAFVLGSDEGGVNDPTRTDLFNVRDWTLLAAIVVGFTSFFLFGFKLMEKSECHQLKEPGLLHKFLDESARPLPPVDLIEGVKYTYIDRKALLQTQSQSQAFWIGAIELVLLSGMFFIIPEIRSLPGGLFFLALSLACAWGVFKLSSREKFAKLWLGDTVWIEGETLHLSHDGQEHSYPNRAIVLGKHWESCSPTYMAWYETYSNGASTFPLDRRYLTPNEDQ